MINITRWSFFVKGPKSLNLMTLGIQGVPFQAASHRITVPLHSYARDLLELGFTNKCVSELTGLCKNTVKAIDKERLLGKYTVSDHVNQPKGSADIFLD